MIKKRKLKGFILRLLQRKGALSSHQITALLKEQTATYFRRDYINKRMVVMLLIELCRERKVRKVGEVNLNGYRTYIWGVTPDLECEELDDIYYSGF